MREEEIRPADLTKKCEELFYKDSEDFLRYSDKFIDIECPACGIDNKQVTFIKDGYVFKKCNNCQTFYISPRPTPELLKIYYSTSRASKFWQDYVFPRSKEARRKSIYKPRADLIMKIIDRFKIGNELLVDIGAGSGFFGEEVAARRVFKKIILIEPGPIKIKDSSVIKVINDSFEKTSLDLNPNVITNFELIEHLFSPKDFLLRVYSLMKEGSYFIFTTPNMHGFELLTTFDKSKDVGGPDHLNYFNIESIKLLLKRVGFRNMEVSTPGELDADIVRGKYLQGEVDISEQKFLHYILIEKPDVYLQRFQDFLKENRLSSHMLILAQK